MSKKYDIAAYIWPSYTGDEPRSRIFWEEGIGEWQTVKNSTRKACGYLWDRKPLWGYVNEADPYVMSMQIDAAVQHGINVFIYDWYWYDNRPFLENCLNDGFLKAHNCNKMKFYIMWANHNANYLWDIRNSDSFDTTVWNGAVNREQFEIIGKRWIEKYFTKENYYKINEKPVVCIYDMFNFVTGLGGLEATASAISWLNDKAKESGLPGVHFQYIIYGNNQNVTGVDGNRVEVSPETLKTLGFESVTNYQFVHFVSDIDRDYNDIVCDARSSWEKFYKNANVTYYPHVSVGWDNNPRHKQFKPGVVKNNTPENFEKALYAVKEFADKTNVNLITINSWNEWTETSYLQPDNIYGYGYLDAVKKVFG